MFNMLSQLVNLVPVLEGFNYQAWAPSMQNYLQSQGQWWILKKTCPDLEGESTTTVGTGDDAVVTTAPGTEKEVEDWEDTNSRALSNICLRLHHTIQYKYKAKESTGALWLALEAEYGKPGVVTLYLEFKGILDTRIPENEDPTSALNKIESHVG
jgi:hypothetical protein